MYVRHLLICAFVARMAAFHASLQAKSSMDLEFQGIGLAEIVGRGRNPSFCAAGSEFGLPNLVSAIYLGMRLLATDLGRLQTSTLGTLAAHCSRK
jgi:hypothetical protein